MPQTRFSNHHSAMSPPLPSGPSLSHLNQRRLAVELPIRSRLRVFCGLGTFDSGSDMGPILRIAIDGTAEPLEIILQERRWCGQIECGQRFGCDYFLQCE